MKWVYFVPKTISPSYTFKFLAEDKMFFLRDNNKAKTYLHNWHLNNTITIVI